MENTMATHHGSGFHHSEAELQSWKRKTACSVTNEENVTAG